MSKSEQDPLYQVAVEHVTKTGKATTSGVQRALKVGYNRAAHIMEQMESVGIVTPIDATGSRTVNGNWKQAPNNTPPEDLVAMATGNTPPAKKKTAPKKKSTAKKKRARPKAVATKRKPPPKKKAASKKKAAAKPAPKPRNTKPLPKYHINHQSWDKEAVMRVIFERMTSSSKGIAYICRDDDELPGISTVFNWMADEEIAKASGEPTPLLDMYARAKDIQVDYMADEIVEIGDNEVGTVIMVDDVPLLDEKGNPIKIVDSAAVQHAKLRADNRKWIASKLKHRKYGDKLEISGDPERPLAGKTDEELAQRRMVLLKQLEQLEN